MENEFIYLSYDFRAILNNIFSQLLLSLSDCHYLYNIKGSDFKHRISGLESHLVTFRTAYLTHHNAVNIKELYETVIYIENVLSTFTCGSHRLEVRLFNSIFFCKHQLITLLQAIQKDRELQ